jgi:hypothetical protein
MLKEKSRFFIGIDNGVNGAISVIDEKLNIIKVIKYPRYNLYSLYSFLYPYRGLSGITSSSFGVLEKPFIAHNKLNATAISHECFGTHKMNLEALRISYRLADPRINVKNCWRREFNFNSNRTDELKKESIDMVNLIFDGRAYDYLCQRKKNIKSREEYTLPDDNIAESLLLAEYARRLFFNF